jgi:translation initiation factor IF-3
VLVITEAGEQLGTMTVPQALDLARGRGLDLVEVAPNAAPPVCRLLDYGKLRYLYSKKEREAKKSQKNTSLREVRLRPRIGNHDFLAKMRKVKELIDDGSKVKVAVVFRGREVTHRDIGMSLLKRVAEEIQEDARLESPPSMEGRSLFLVLVPAPGKKTEKKVTEGNNAKAEDPQGC